MERVKTGLFLEVLIKQLCERYDCEYKYISPRHIKMFNEDLEQLILKYFEKE